ncbi:DUF167 domain-containing protein [Leisingera methylohalidivorans]|uniref:Uncharacterized protein n=1 Tax=Leisingera methylohalidivorans DSM 14336 TaxID=999552 RepID=V9VS85_9RHOB|nr:DUF167 domain-containing protein [Leisingera methylohalidivorans]AHD00190.1 hypothetical protein METH_05150 [Leisingera methylohalidivorans DSM 14336]
MGKPKKKNLPDLGHLCVPGLEIAVRATPKAARNAIVPAEGVLKVSVTAAPENGKATEAVRSLLAAAMGTAASNLNLRRGAASRSKVFVYTGPA